MNEIFIGIDLGGTNIKIGCFDSDIKLIRKTSTPTRADMGPDTVADKMAQTAEKLLTDAGLSLQEVPSVGLGCPGPAKYREGIMESATNLPEFKNIPFRKMLSERLGKPVVFENDANVACWGEYAVGAGKGVEDMVFFTLGTGIGGGIINNGKLVHGCGDNAAELGHIIIHPDGRMCNCGQRGCVEAYASANSTAKRATEAVQGGAKSSLKKVLDENDEITCKDVYEHLKAGDKLAKKITDETAMALAIVCINMLHITEPKRIVFAGGMIGAGEILLNRIKDYFNEHIWALRKEPVEICFATLGEDAGIIGAAALAKQAYDEGKLKSG
ncbi:MAG: ROK family glucokinase [Planctomycetota bacterium]|nr:MAG: ROK family glucokinase [Planctomycetota bacterium]